MTSENPQKMCTLANSIPDGSTTDSTTELKPIIGEKVTVYPCWNPPILDGNAPFSPYTVTKESFSPASANIFPDIESYIEAFEQEDTLSENGKKSLCTYSRSHSDGVSPKGGPDGENLHLESAITNNSAFSYATLSFEISKETYIIEQSLFGSLAEVLVGIHISSGQKVILKRVTLDNPRHMSILSYEANVLNCLNHPRIVSVLSGMHRDDTHAYIFLEYLEGCDVLHYLTAVKIFSESDCRCIFRSAIEGIAYLHAHGFIHRDIKPDNLMLSKPRDFSSLKLIDFGLVKYIGNKPISDNRISGTAGYIAPEIFSRSPYGYPADIYSLGITLYLVLTGVHPFYDFEEKQINLYRNASGKVTFPSTRWNSRSMAIRELVSQMCAVDPTKRPTAQELLNHPLLKF